MLTKRTFFLTGLGLLMGYLAAAQTPAAPASGGSNLLFGFVLGLLALVALAVVLTGAMVSSQLRHRRQYSAETPTDTTAAERGVPAC
ncbi:hypothetical protein [Hymenobacter psychrotolerans]|uniref:Uncharacterized protein n=1 Tax=Hymenobacter psychrotolerans DSM 18569 TaxID=1121959 RepID=A0A1M6YIB1_9BACT|nr:hypothetical protein [Hymenobacter psychrotolerans]SHL17862.1 hypothetical protein SAMN02746009_02261 [Hymenobacter psychrotolerans DSM 18569]